MDKGIPAFGDVRDRLIALPHHPWPDPATGGHYVTSDIFPTKHRVLQQLAPKAVSVFEIGALVGYFLVTACDALAGVERVGWIDNETYLPGSNRMCGENLEAAFPYVAQLSPPALIDGWPPSWDVVHVDGDHSYDWCLHDLRGALGHDPMLIVVDDTDSHPNTVRPAVLDFCAEISRTPRFYTTANGFAAIVLR